MLNYINHGWRSPSSKGELVHNKHVTAIDVAFWEKNKRSCTCQKGKENTMQRRHWLMFPRNLHMKGHYYLYLTDWTAIWPIRKSINNKFLLEGKPINKHFLKEMDKSEKHLCKFVQRIFNAYLEFVLMWAKGGPLFLPKIIRFNNERLVNSAWREMLV